MPDSPDAKSPVATKPSGGLPALQEELPVVARLIVEVRSDGTRTIARGAMEDATTGIRTSIEASGSTPLALAMTLARSITSAPWFARRLAIGGLRALVRKI